MSTLEVWLAKATRHLSKESIAQVRREIEDHYESAREAAVSRGVATHEADVLAIAALGDAKAANCQYRKVLLTAAEARMLRESNWEAHAICSRPRLKWLLLAIPATMMLTAVTLFLTGSTAISRILFAGGMTMGLIFAAPFLPIYTPGRGRVFRWVKCLLLAAMLVLAFGPLGLKWSWLLASCLWPLAWTEWTRISIRRKLPVAQWPKQLYL